MNDLQSTTPPFRSPEGSIGVTLRRIRTTADLTLSQLAERCDLAPSTLSKIENGQMSPTYDTIVRLANGLRINPAELFDERQHFIVNGRRAVTRKNEGRLLKTSQYDYEMLCFDIAGKQFVPILTRIKAQSMEAFGRLFSHVGEEFVYVLAGCVVLHTQYYAPTELNEGDCCYYDSPMGHAIISTGKEPATLLWVCSRVVEPLTA